MMDESVELIDVCRLCLLKKDKNIHIFAQNDPGEETLISKIRACVDVEVSRGDDLPKQICLQCSCHINLWYYYKQTCVKSQRKLKAWHSQASKTNESNCEIDEIIHIKQEPPDFPSESFRERSLDTSHNAAVQNSSIGGGLESENADGIDDENEEEEIENSENPMNLIIMDATTIPTDNLNCQGGMVSTVIELQPEDEDLLRTVVESEDLRNQGDDGDDDEVTVVQVGREDSGTDMLEEITIDEDSDHSSAVEEALEEDLESAAVAPPLEPPKSLSGECNIPLVRVKEEKEDCWWPATNSSAAKKQVTTPTPAAFTPTGTPSAAAAGTNPLSWKCPKCPRTFSSNKTKNIHLAKSHKDKSENGTVQSGDSSPARLPLPKIVTALYDEDAKLCKLCNRKFANHHYLWRHLRQSHEDQKPFACQVCRRFFKTKRELTTHRLRTISKQCRLGKTLPQTDIDKICTVNPNIPNNVQGRYTCKECPMQFKCLSFIKRHFTVHSGEHPYECPKCRREYRDYKTASTHYKICNAPFPVYIYTPNINAPPGNYKCPKCPKVFGHATSLWKHKKRGCSKRQFCPKCSESIDLREWKTHTALCNVPTEKSPYLKVRDPRKRVERTSLTLEDILDIHRTVRGQPPTELKCKVCNSVFGSLKSLKAHIRKHVALPGTPSSVGTSLGSPSPQGTPTSQGSPTSLRCNICNLSVQHESTLRSHMESYHGEGVPAVKPTSALLAKHKARLGGFTSSKLKCDQCHKLFSSMSALQFHKRTHKPRDASTLTCPVCKKVFMTPTALVNHKKIHASIQLKMKIYKCTFCDNSYSDAKELQLHKMSDHPEEETSPTTNAVSPGTETALENSVKEEVPTASYECDTCGKYFTAESSLIRHKKLHEASQDISKFKCETCNKSFLSSKSFDSHKGWHSRSSSTLPPMMPKIGLHPKMKTQKFDCPVCGKGFLHKANAKRHMIMQNHNSKGPPIANPPLMNSVVPVVKTEYKCKDCPQVFSYLKAYKKHLKDKHSKEPKKESSCGVSTSDAPEEGSLVCKLCKKTLRSVKGYKKHLLGHSNQKPFKCDVCSNQYSSETALTKHKLAHEFKAFACNKCKACFAEKEELISHYESCNA